jgi:X-X-X-Leu-X-X-Gly heptad repeat protein
MGKLMKNFNVGIKLFIGFGIVILLMVVILAVTVITSLTRNDDLELLNDLSELQTEIIAARAAVSNSRVELRTVFTSALVNDDEYNLAIEYLEEADTHIQAAKAISSTKLNNEQLDTLTQLDKAIDDTQTAVTKVHQSDLDTRVLVEKLSADGTILAEDTSAAMNLILNQITADLENSDDTLRRLDFANEMSEYYEHLTTMRVLARAVTLKQDTSVIPEIFNLEQEMDKITNDIIARSTLLETQNTLHALDDVAAEYRSLLVEMQGVLASADAAVVDARAALEILVTGTTTIADKIDDSVANSLSSNIATSMTVMMALTLVVLVSILVAILMAITITKAITTPLSFVKTAMEQVGNDGNLVFPDDTWVDMNKYGAARDEIGALTGSFGKLLKQFIYYGECIETVAERDLSINVKVLGGNDTIGISLGKTISTLSEMFGEIKASSEQVTTGASQIADGAQSLAQGATEQAASVQQLSSSIQEVASKTEQNSKMAIHAADLSGTIKDNAQRGTDQMNQMMVAVREINEASNNINQVIKTIDNIAFQTNILALNAAVEAARAGQHGKGFAVVAEEVRSLAAKSADAAKSTSELIESSIEKATQGAKIADETSASLAEIVNGINESTEIVTQIAESSEEQSVQIKQINIGIDQVAQVVQQNSATAEESAAASEQMSGQSNMLNELISQFKLSSDSAIGSGKRKAALPAARSATSASKAADSYDFSGDSFGKY